MFLLIIATKPIPMPVYSLEIFGLAVVFSNFLAQPGNIGSDNVFGFDAAVGVIAKGISDNLGTG